MNKDDMARALAKECGITNEKAHKYISGLKKVIMRGLKEDGSVKWVGLGTWERRKEKRVHGIPGVFDDTIKPECYGVSFHAGLDLLNLINEV